VTSALEPKAKTIFVSMRSMAISAIHMSVVFLTSHRATNFETPHASLFESISGHSALNFSSDPETGRDPLAGNSRS
jgi:hypothetical protein